MAIQVSKIMSSPAITIGYNGTLDDVHKTFIKHHFHHLIVLDEAKKIAGIISDRDVLKHLSPFIGTYAEQRMDRDTLKKSTRQIMTPNPITIYSDQTIPHAANLMISNDISCLPVVSHEGNIVGVLSWKDILRVIACAK